MGRFVRVVTAGEVVKFLGTRVRNSSTSGESELQGASALFPGMPNHLAFDSSRDAKNIRDTEASLVLVASGRTDDTYLRYSNWIAVDDPKLEFARVCREFGVARRGTGVHPRAWVDPESNIHSTASIGPGVVVERGARVGARTFVLANTVLCEDVIVGEDVIIGPGCVIGHSGFGYAKDSDGRSYMLPHTGGVVIGDRVEIGANVTIDRGTFVDTVIESDVMIDNAVQVAHNCVIRRGAYLIGHAAIGGSVNVEEDAWVAPNSTLLQHVTIEKGATVGMAAAVFRDVTSGQTVIGNPGRPAPGAGR